MENSKTKVLSIRITEEEHEVLLKNDWIRKEVAKNVNEYLSTFVTTK